MPTDRGNSMDQRGGVAASHTGRYQVALLCEPLGELSGAVRTSGLQVHQMRLLPP